LIYINFFHQSNSIQLLVSSVIDSSHTRFAATRRAGLLPQNLILNPPRRMINHKTVFGTRNPAFWVGAVTSWPFVHHHCKALSSICFQCFCPTVFVSAVGGEEIKHRRVGEKNEFRFGLPKSTLFCKLWFVLGLVRLANVCAFVCRLLMLIVSPISFSTFPSLSFLWSVNL
jgi:hypothetical protein